MESEQEIILNDDHSLFRLIDKLVHVVNIIYTSI